jgi:hypothetical protein
LFYANVRCSKLTLPPTIYTHNLLPLSWWTLKIPHGSAKLVFFLKMYWIDHFAWRCEILGVCFATFPGFSKLCLACVMFLFLFNFVPHIVCDFRIDVHCYNLINNSVLSSIFVVPMSNPTFANCNVQMEQGNENKLLKGSWMDRTLKLKQNGPILQMKQASGNELVKFQWG